MKKLLIVVDYQNDFVNGSLGFEGADKIEDYIVNKIQEFENNNDDVIFTLDTHNSSYFSLIEGKKLPIEHCIKGTKGHDVYGKVYEYSKNHLNIEKNAFGSTKLVEYLSNNKYSEIYLVGLVSSICVFSNAVIARSSSPSSKVIVLRKGTSSYDLEMQEKSFAVLNNLHIDVE